MPDGKWIRDLMPGTPLVEAAQHVLKVRLGTVLDALPRAIENSHKDPEHVHQLRVATRRADAGLRMFRPCFANRAYRSARKRLRLIRRAAGDARDWDVFLLALQERLTKSRPTEASGLDYLIGHAIERRGAAQEALETIESRHPTAFSAFMDEVLSEVGPLEGDSNPRLIDHARPMMEERLEALREAMQCDLNQYENLHQVRIAGKRLRYAMEVVADCFPPAFREELYPVVEEMQEILGRANDSHVASTRLEHYREQARRWPALWKRGKAGIETLLRTHQRRMPVERRRFLAWMKEWEAMQPASFLS